MTQDIARIVAVARDPKATAAQITTALGKARAASTDAEAACVAAADAYQGGLLDLDDKALAKLAADRTAAELSRDRAVAAVTKLECSLAAAEARESEAERHAAYAKAKRLRDAAAKRLAAEYPALVALGLELLQAVAEADTAIEAANGDLPTGCERLSGTEAVARAVPGLPREVVAEESVALWCQEGAAEPISDELQERVTSQGNGYGYYSTGTGQHHFVRRHLRRVSFRPAVATRYATPLAVALALPALRPGDAQEWTPEPAGQEAPSPGSVLARLERIGHAATAKPETPARRIAVEHLPGRPGLAA